METAEDRRRATRNVTLMSIGVAATLVAIKFVVWLLGRSDALLASASDSGLDLFASTTNFFAVRWAAAPPDREHRFGHGKGEAFASLLQAGLVFASAALVAEEAVRHLIHPQPIAFEGWGVAVMVVSIALTAGLVFVQTRLLRSVASVAVSADRAHFAADLGSNVVALVAIAVAWLGLVWADALGGLAVAAILLWGAVSVFREASSQLLDHELPDDDRRRIVELMTSDPAIRHVHQLRTRASGPIVHIQMHADLDPDLTLEVAHKAVVAAERRVLSAFPDADILIHPDPEGRAEPHGGAFGEALQRAEEAQ
jgi:cation diffusion facilitator family transporter